MSANNFITLEDLAPIVFENEKIKFTPLTKLARVYINGQRYYFERGAKNSKILPSVSTFLERHIPLPQHLLKWMLDNGEDAITHRDRRANYGTSMHVCIEKMVKQGYCITNGEIRDIAFEFLPDITPAELTELQKDICAFAVFAASVDLEPVALEVPLYSSKYGFAGTADLPAKITIKNARINALIDMKSGRKGFYDRHHYQLLMYREAWNEHYGDIFPIKRVFNWAPKDWRKTPDYNFHEWDDKDEVTYKHLLDLFRHDKAKFGNENIDKDVFMFDGISMGVPQYSYKKLTDIIKEL